MFNKIFFKSKINLYFLKAQIRQGNFLSPIYLVPTIYILEFYKVNLIPLLLIILNKTFTNPLSFYNFSEKFITYFNLLNFKIIRIAGFYTLFLYNIFLLIGFLLFKHESLEKYFFQFEILLIVSVFGGSLINSISENFTRIKILVSILNTLFFGVLIYVTYRFCNFILF